jgi:hypothetical protein
MVKATSFPSLGDANHLTDHFPDADLYRSENHLRVNVADAGNFISNGLLTLQHQQFYYLVILHHQGELVTTYF